MQNFLKILRIRDLGNLIETLALFWSGDGGEHWEDVANVPWKSPIVCDTEFDGHRYVITAADVFNPTWTGHHAYRIGADGSWREVDIVPGTDEMVCGLGVVHGRLHALAATATFPEGYTERPLQSIRGPIPITGRTVWESRNGISWRPIGEVPTVPGFLLCGADRMFAVNPLVNPLRAITHDSMSKPFADGIHYSRDGLDWALWRNWPEGFQHRDLRYLAPLFVMNGALYAQVGHGPPSALRNPELWKIPLSDFE